MRKIVTIGRVLLIGISVLPVASVFTRCNRDPGEFRITNAQFTDTIYAGQTKESAKAYDLLVWYGGKPAFPLKAVFYMVTTEQSGDFQKVEKEIQTPGSPIMLKKFYSFWGFTSTDDMVYAVALEEVRKDGKKTEPFQLKVRVHPPAN